MTASRSYDRAPADIRPVTIDPGFVESAEGSALISGPSCPIKATLPLFLAIPHPLRHACPVSKLRWPLVEMS